MIFVIWLASSSRDVDPAGNFITSFAELCESKGTIFPSSFTIACTLGGASVSDLGGAGLACPFVLRNSRVLSKLKRY